jgi:hypothetical protein
MNIQIAMQLAKKSGIIEGRRYDIQFSSLANVKKRGLRFRGCGSIRGAIRRQEKTAAGSVDQPANSTAICFFCFSPARNEKACRGRRCGRLSKRTEQQLGGGVLLFPQAASGGG